MSDHSVKPLDLSHALQHALLAGQKGVWWVDYDPTECSAYRRLENLQARCDKLEAAAALVCADAVPDSVHPESVCEVGTPELEDLRSALSLKEGE